MNNNEAIRVIILHSDLLQPYNMIYVSFKIQPHRIRILLDKSFLLTVATLIQRVNMRKRSNGMLSNNVNVKLSAI